MKKAFAFLFLIALIGAGVYFYQKGDLDNIIPISSEADEYIEKMYPADTTLVSLPPRVDTLCFAKKPSTTIQYFNFIDDIDNSQTIVEFHGKDGEIFRIAVREKCYLDNASVHSVILCTGDKRRLKVKFIDRTKVQMVSIQAIKTENGIVIIGQDGKEEYFTTTAANPSQSNAAPVTAATPDPAQTDTASELDILKAKVKEAQRQRDSLENLTRNAGQPKPAPQPENETLLQEEKIPEPAKPQDTQEAQPQQAEAE